MKLSDRYEEVSDEIYEIYMWNGNMYALYDLMDADRLVLQVYEQIQAGELKAAVDRLRVAYTIIQENVEAAEADDADDS